ncbi:MAG: putative molybdenum carrier protein [Desulforhopalus sp.]
MLKKIISGGQTGVDRAGLDAAIKFSIPHGGAIPRGRRTEDGVLPEYYNLTELSSTSYPARTEKNVVDADATVIFSHGPLSNGSLLTKKKALLYKRPVLHLDLRRIDIDKAASLLVEFIRSQAVEVLNIAGPRASGDPYIYGATLFVLEVALSAISKNVSVENVKNEDP